MNRRSFFTKLFGGAAISTVAAFTPRYHPSWDGVRDLQVMICTAIPADYLIQAKGIMNAAKLRQAMMDSYREDIELAAKMGKSKIPLTC